jgi:hypothetical protein
VIVISTPSEAAYTPNPVFQLHRHNGCTEEDSQVCRSQSLSAPPPIRLALTIDIQVKRVIGKRDGRRKENIKKNEEAQAAANKKSGPDGELVREVPQMPSQMFDQANLAMTPPYSVLVDTSFLNSKAPQSRTWVLEANGTT